MTIPVGPPEPVCPGNVDVPSGGGAVIEPTPTGSVVVPGGAIGFRDSEVVHAPRETMRAEVPSARVQVVRMMKLLWGLIGEAIIVPSNDARARASFPR